MVLLGTFFSYLITRYKNVGKKQSDIDEASKLTDLTLLLSVVSVKKSVPFMMLNENASKMKN